ncbi:MAG: hypothetical protein L0323_03075 [Planctomycetes bacterium]|nr:hypothetical protein [Planctomycetota bacterium]
MRTRRFLPVAALALLPLAAPASACPDCGILPGPTTDAPEVFSMEIEGGESGYQMRFALYADRTFEMVYQGELVLVEAAAPEVYQDFVRELRMSGFLDLERIRTASTASKKALGDSLVTSLSAYGGLATFSYAAENYAVIPEVVQNVQAAFEDLILDVVLASGLAAA